MLKDALFLLTEYKEYFIKGTLNTLLFSFSGTAIGILIGLCTGIIRTAPESKNPVLRVIQKIVNALIYCYVEVFRGTPMMVQAVFIYYLVYTNIVHWDKMVAAIFVISINTGAYMAEIVRAGIQAVDPGQNEAARSLGMSSMQTMMDIVLPQAIRNAFPAIGNELIVNIKDSSVLMIISITELMFQSNSIAGTTYRFTETYFVTAFIYLCLTGISSIILNAIEKKLNHTKTSLPQSDTDVKSISIAKEGM